MAGSDDKRTLKLTEKAWGDLFRLMKHFDERREGLGEDVGDLALNILERHVLPSPRTPARHPREPSLRVYRVVTYSLRLFYTLDDDDSVVVVAFEHMRELPDKWRGRLLQQDEADS